MKTAKRILIVDDDTDIINVVRTILENENYEVFEANGKEEALKLLETLKPNLAILDVMMNTQYEGFELAEEIKTNHKEIPVVMQTSIEVFNSPDADAMGYARAYRNQMKDKNMEVLLVQNTIYCNAGIDYRNEEGKIIWLPIDGFIRKPVKAKNLLETINKIVR